MNIAIDMQPLCNTNTPNRGIPNFAYNLILEMLAQDQKNQYVLFNIYSDFPALDRLFGKGKYPNLREFHLYTGRQNVLLWNDYSPRMRPLREVAKKIVDKFLSDFEIDVFFTPSPIDNWNCFEPGWFKDVRAVALVHDIIPHMMREKYLLDEQVKKAYYSRLDMIKDFDLLLSNSVCVKNDHVRELGFDPDRFEVIYAGFSQKYNLIMPTKDEAQAVREKFGITGPFIFCAGGDDLRKNMSEMVQAYARLPQNLIDRYQLAVVCGLSEAFVQHLRKIATEEGLPQDRLVITNFVSEEDLIFLYKMSDLMFFASKYEGFGMPIVEAMACGTPVVTSNVSATAEIAEGAAILVDPLSIESMTDGLKKALSEGMEKYRPTMAERVKSFTWKNSAKKALSAIAKLEPVKRTPVSTGENGKIKIAYFTPLPPVKSGISDYSAELLPKLAELVDVDVFIDDDYEPELHTTNNISVHRHGEYPAKRNGYAITLYQVGNGMAHTYMLPYLKDYPDVVELHDVNLNIWLATLLVKQQKDPAAYTELYAQDYPVDKALLQKEIENGAFSVFDTNICLNGVATKAAHKIIVHSQYAKEALLRTDISRVSTVVPLFSEAKQALSTRDARAKLAIPEGQLMFASFGVISHNRRIDIVLKAFASMKDTQPDAHYYIVGRDDGETISQLTALVDQLNLAERVTFVDNPTKDAFVTYIQACDFCVSLRWPTQGETSGVVTRAIRAGKPLIVTDAGAFSELDDSFAVKIPAGESKLQKKLEGIALEAALAHMLGSEPLRERMGACASAYADDNLGIDKIARVIVQAALASPKPPLLTEKLLSELTPFIEPYGGEEDEVNRIAETLSFLNSAQGGHS